MSITNIKAKYGERVDVIPSFPSTFCLSVTDESGTYADAFLSDEQAAQVAAALTDQESKPVKENARFADIRKGDRVRTTTTYSNGTVQTTEGVVDHLAYRTAWDEHENTLYDEIDDDNPRVTLTILSRPTPKYGPGDYVFDRDDRVWRMDDDGDWNEPGTDHYYSPAEALELDYGPLRRAKVVEADQ